MAKKFLHSYEVCKCNHVTLSEIIDSIQRREAKSIKDIGEKTDAGVCCGRCKNKDSDFGEEKMELYLDQVLNKFK